MVGVWKLLGLKGLTLASGELWFERERRPRLLVGMGVGTAAERLDRPAYLLLETE